MVLVGVAGVLSTAQMASAATSPLLIIALQTGGPAGAGEEFIELANITLQPQSLDDVYVEYYPATSLAFGKPSRRIALAGTLAASTTYLLATPDYSTQVADQPYAATLAATGGCVRLVGPSGELDVVSWGTAKLGRPALAPASGQALRRRSQAGVYVDTGNSQADFSEDTPATDWTAQLELSEVLPDPVAPATDATGEFIEVYNSGSVPGTMRGWKIAIGTKTFTLPDQIISAGGYAAFYASQTKLSLSNSGTRVVLVDPNGEAADELTYGKATAGSAWAWSGQAWQWTGTVTPGEPNQMTSTALAAASTQSTKTGIVKTTKTTKTKSKKTTSKTKTKTKSRATKAKIGKVDAAATSVPAVADEQAKPTVHNAVIAGVGGLAVLYGAYEYRYDVINLYQKLRRNRKAG